MLISLAACTDQNGKDDPDSPDFEEGIPTEVRITLSARSGNAQTRADRDGEDKDPTSTIELIHNWWIVFINKNGEIVKVIKSTDSDVTDKKSSTSVNVVDGDVNDKGYEAQTFRTIIPSGTYRVYTFANIPPDLEIFKNPAKFNNGKHKDMYIDDFIPDAYTHNSNTANDGMQWPATYQDKDGNTVYNYIPMTQVFPIPKDGEEGDAIVIRNTVEEAFNLEVVRTVAKVEFAFSNPSADEIEVKDLEFSPISKGTRISIVPNNDSVGFGPNNKLVTDILNNDPPIGGTGTLKFHNISLVKDRSEKDYMGKFDFYCKESLPQENGGPFTIKLTITRNGVEESKNLYTSKITYINRNDWIYIPIKFNEWTIIWHLHYYPPIGGYTPVFVQSNDGKSAETILTTGGEFEIYPEIKKGSESFKLTSELWSSNVEVSELSKIIQTELDGETPLSGKSLFVTGKEPKIVDNPGNVGGHPLSQADYPKLIIGELDPKQEGKATMTITFRLPDTAYSGTVMECKFTITRQNGYQTTPSN